MSITLWDWTSSQGTSSKKEVQAAYQALVDNGWTTQFDYKVWNDMVTFINKIAVENGGWTTSDKFLPLDEMKMSSDDKILTAQRFNTLMAQLRYSYWSWWYKKDHPGYLSEKRYFRGEQDTESTELSPDFVYGRYFLELIDVANFIAEIINGDDKDTYHLGATRTEQFTHDVLLESYKKGEFIMDDPTPEKIIFNIVFRMMQFVQKPPVRMYTDNVIEHSEIAKIEGIGVIPSQPLDWTEIYSDKILCATLEDLALKNLEVTDIEKDKINSAILNAMSSASLSVQSTINVKSNVGVYSMDRLQLEFEREHIKVDTAIPYLAVASALELFIPREIYKITEKSMTLYAPTAVVLDLPEELYKFRVKDMEMRAVNAKPLGEITELYIEHDSGSVVAPGVLNLGVIPKEEIGIRWNEPDIKTVSALDLWLRKERYKFRVTNPELRSITAQTMFLNKEHYYGLNNEPNLVSLNALNIGAVTPQIIEFNDFTPTLTSIGVQSLNKGVEKYSITQFISDLVSVGLIGVNAVTSESHNINSSDLTPLGISNLGICDENYTVNGDLTQLSALTPTWLNSSLLIGVESDQSVLSHTQTLPFSQQSEIIDIQDNINLETIWPAWIDVDETIVVNTTPNLEQHETMPFNVDYKVKQNSSALFEALFLKYLDDANESIVVKPNIDISAPQSCNIKCNDVENVVGNIDLIQLKLKFVYGSDKEKINEDFDLSQVSPLYLSGSTTETVDTDSTTITHQRTKLFYGSTKEVSLADCYANLEKDVNRAELFATESITTHPTANISYDYYDLSASDIFTDDESAELQDTTQLYLDLNAESTITVNNDEPWLDTDGVGIFIDMETDVTERFIISQPEIEDKRLDLSASVVESDISTNVLMLSQSSEIMGSEVIETMSSSAELDFETTSFGVYYGYVEEEEEPMSTEGMTFVKKDESKIKEEGCTIDYAADYQKCVFIYPERLGALTSIKYNGQSYEFLNFFEVKLLNGMYYYWESSASESTGYYTFYWQ